MSYQILGVALGHGGFPEWYPLKTYPYPVPGPWSYNPQYPAGYGGPEPYFIQNDDGTMTQVMGENEEKASFPAFFLPLGLLALAFLLAPGRG